MDRYLSREEEKRATISKRKISFSKKISEDAQSTMTNVPTKWKSWDLTRIKTVSPKLRARKEMTSVPLELSRARALSDKTSVWQILSRRRNSSSEDKAFSPRKVAGNNTKRDTMPLPSIGKSRLRRLSITAARNSARRRTSTSSSLKMPELQAWSPTPSQDNSSPRRLRRLSINAARKCATRRLRLSGGRVTNDDDDDDGTGGRLWKKVRSTILAVAMFKRAIDFEHHDEKKSDSSNTWASSRLVTPRTRPNTPVRLAPLSTPHKLKKKGRRNRKTPPKEKHGLPNLRNGIPSLRIDSSSPW